MYADDLLLLSPSFRGMQIMLDICTQYGLVHNIVFNAVKTVSTVIGHRRTVFNESLYISDRPIPWVDSFKYLGVMFIAHSNLKIDFSYCKRKFYSAVNCIGYCLMLWGLSCCS